MRFTALNITRVSRATRRTKVVATAGVLLASGAGVILPSVGSTHVLASAAAATRATTTPTTHTTLDVQFGPSGAAVASGYALDTGLGFDQTRGYGWSTPTGAPVSVAASTRVRHVNPDPKLDSLVQSNHLGPVVWQAAVPNGRYVVSVSVGDPSWIDSIDQVNVEGTALIKGFVPTDANHYTSGSTAVNVTNGLLTVDWSGGTNTKLNYVDFAPAPAPTTPTGQIAWFFKHPLYSTDTPTVVNSFNRYVLTTGDESLRDQILAAKPGTLIDQYFLMDQIIKPPSGYTSYHNNAAYDPGSFSSLWTNHPDWFLRDANGNPIVEGGNYYRMDPGNAGWRAYWTSQIAAANAKWSGVFADNTSVSLCAFDKTGVKIPEYPTDAAWTDAIAGFLQYANANYFAPAHKDLTVNLTDACTGRDGHEKYMPYVGGTFDEGWGVDWHTGYLSATSWAKQLAQVDTDANQIGKSMILVSQGAQTDTARQQFAYASYLLVSGPNITFRYAQYFAPGGYAVPWIYPDYSVKLGTPLGARYVQADGSWRRDFTNGYVSVNPTTHVSNIVPTS